jgi:hypothetical protein
VKKLEWNGFLERIGTVEFDLSPDTGRGASLNIRVEGNHYSFPIKDPERAKKIPQVQISPELKDEIILRARERLASMEDFLNFVDRSTAKKIVLASAALATFDAIEEAIP